MELPQITFSDELLMAELMAPPSEFNLIQDPKLYVNDVPAQQLLSNYGNEVAIQQRHSNYENDVAIQQRQLDRFQSSDTNNELLAEDSTVTESSTTMYPQRACTPPQHPYGMNPNASPSNLHSNDEFLFDGMNRDFEEPKPDYSFMCEYSDSPNPTDNNSFCAQKPAPFPLETRDAFSAQVQDGYYAQEVAMIPSVVDHGAEALAAAAIKNEHPSQSGRSETGNLAVSGENNVDAVSRASNAGSGRRRSCKGPKPKLHQRAEPYSDAEMEIKRKNAIKAYRNRIRAKEEKETMEAEISRLNALLQEKDDIIKRLTEDRRVEKGNRIRALQEELATLTVSYNSL